MSEKRRAFPQILIVGVVICLALVAKNESSSQGSRAIFDPRTISLKTCDNGLRIIVRETHSVPIVALQVWVRVGSRNETPETNGICHILEHLMFRGSQNKAPGQVNNEIEGVGGYVNAETTQDATRFHAVLPSHHFDLALNGYADALLRPKLEGQALEIEKRTIALELVRRLTSPVAALGDMVSRKAYTVHPYGLPMGGKTSTLEKITRAMLLDFHRKYYVAKNITIVIVGDISTEEAFRKAEEAFRTARADPPPKLAIPPEPPQTTIREVSDTRNVQQTAISVTVHAPGIGRPRDVLAMDVLITLLGEGRTSRLQKILKGESPLVTDYHVDFLTQKDPGLLSVTCLLPGRNVEAARTAILQSFLSLQQSLVDIRELSTAKALLEGQYAASNETYDGQAASLGFYDMIDSYRFAITYLDGIRSVTAEDVQRVARTYLKTTAYTFGVIRSRQPKPVATVNLFHGMTADAE